MSARQAQGSPRDPYSPLPQPEQVLLVSRTSLPGWGRLRSGIPSSHPLFPLQVPKENKTHQTKLGFRYQPLCRRRRQRSTCPPGLTLPGTQRGLGHRGRSGGPFPPSGAVSQPGSQQGRERGRVSNVLLTSEEKVSVRTSPQGQQNMMLGRAGRDGPRGKGELGRLRQGQEGQRSPGPLSGRAGWRTEHEWGQRGSSKISLTHLGPGLGRVEKVEEGRRRDFGPSWGRSRQPRGERAAAAAAASRRRVWPGERLRAGGRGPRRAQSFPLGFPGFRAWGESCRGETLR